VLYACLSPRGGGCACEGWTGRGRRALLDNSAPQGGGEEIAATHSAGTAAPARTHEGGKHRDMGRRRRRRRPATRATAATVPSGWWGELGVPAPGTRPSTTKGSRRADFIGREEGKASRRVSSASPRKVENRAGPRGARRGRRAQGIVPGRAGPESERWAMPHATRSALA
jgi:hypothetical protein